MCIGIKDENQAQGMEKQELGSDLTFLDVTKRNIWAFVGVQSILILPHCDQDISTSVSYIASAKTAGVQLVTVVTNTAGPNNEYQSWNSKIERFLTSIDMGCCFVRLPFDLVHPSDATQPDVLDCLDDIGYMCAKVMVECVDHTGIQYELRSYRNNLRACQTSTTATDKDSTGTIAEKPMIT